MTKFLHSLALLSILITTSAANASIFPCLRDERHITILGTNDIHGSVEPTTLKKTGEKIGGMSFFAGAVEAIRKGVRKQFGSCGGVLVVDAGDQFQGTLISNFTEGSLVFDTMSEAGYDAVVPGNHDYDFGPTGWLVDKVGPDTNKNPREVIENLAKKARFPLISANTYLRETLTDISGDRVDVEHAGCKPKSLGKTIEFAMASRPSFLKPYIIKKVAGVRVALIGLDNVNTPSITTFENVSDLCFRDPVETYLETRKSLEGKADVFVIVIHDGDADKDKGLTSLLTSLTSADRPLVDAVIAGHTHYVNNVNVKGVRGIQSGSGGDQFGRINLTYKRSTKSVALENTTVFAGVDLLHERCANQATFCEFEEQTKTISYDKKAVRPNSTIDGLIQDARMLIDPISGQILGEAMDVITVNRINESPMADIMTDALRSLSGADIAFINTGGIRAPLQKGAVNYESFFRVFPFNNRAVLTKPVPVTTILALLQRSIATCGNYGALMQSGLIVEFTRDCKNAPQGVDPNAILQTVKTIKGEVLLDVKAGITPDPTRAMTLATLDFLLAGGSAYDLFKTVQPEQDLGVLRELLVKYYTGTNTKFTNTLDRRWMNIQELNK